MSARAWLDSWRLRVAELTARRRARRELLAMDERALRDIGLGRSDLPAVLAHRFDEAVSVQATAHREHDMKELLGSMLDYNRWAYLRLASALEPVSEADYRADHGLFFRSLHGTLNHLLLAERVWYGRFSGQPCTVRSLADELEAERAPLLAQVHAQAARWPALLAAADAATLGRRLEYRSLVAGECCSSVWAQTLLHVVNHATHHRGQMSAVLTRLGQPAPQMDYIYFVRQQTVAT